MILSKWRIIIVAIIGVKLLLMALVTPWGDLLNWTRGASIALGFIGIGRFPPLSITGVYGPIEILLVPFFWVWTKLPIPHPPLEHIFLSNYSISEISLSVLMKLPSFLADVATGGLLSRLVKQITKSDSRARIALLSWYVNPFNLYYIEVFGAMDTIPAAIIVLGLILGMESKWFRSGICASIGTVLRIFPLFMLPFLFTTIKTKLLRRYAALLAGFLLPLSAALITMYAYGAGTITALANLPHQEYWLLDFLGVTLSQNVTLTPVVLVLQLLVTIYFWRKNTILHAATVSLLALSVAALPFGGSEQHFIWVSPLLSACLAVNLDELWVFVFTFATACLYPSIFPVHGLSYIEPLLAGAFYGAKATYLTKINFENIRESISAKKKLNAPTIGNELPDQIKT